MIPAQIAAHTAKFGEVFVKRSISVRLAHDSWPCGRRLRQHCHDAGPGTATPIQHVLLHHQRGPERRQSRRSRRRGRALRRTNWRAYLSATATGQGAAANGVNSQASITVMVNISVFEQPLLSVTITKLVKCVPAPYTDPSTVTAFCVMSPVPVPGNHFKSCARIDHATRPLRKWCHPDQRSTTGSACRVTTIESYAIATIRISCYDPNIICTNIQ